MKLIYQAFKAFSALKQAGILLAVLVSLWGTFKVTVYVHDRNVRQEQLNKIREAENAFIKQDKEDVKEIVDSISNSSRDERNERLCGGKCPEGTDYESSLSSWLGDNPVGGVRSRTGTSDDRYIIERYLEQQRKPKRIPEEVFNCTFQQISDCGQFPNCCIVE